MVSFVHYVAHFFHDFILATTIGGKQLQHLIVETLTSQSDTSILQRAQYVDTTPQFETWKERKKENK